jgi:hypothetical protein
MAHNLIPVSPQIHVTVSEPGGGTSPGLLVALRCDDQTESTGLFVATRHHGVKWLEPDVILEAWSE